MTVLCRTLILVACAICACTTVGAQEITLTARDGTLEVSGTLLSYDSDTYRLDTVYGPLTVNASGVECSGVDCPDVTATLSKVSLSGTALIGAALVPSLLEGFANREGFAVTRTDQSADRFSYALTPSDSNVPIAQFSFHTSTTEEGFADLLANEADIVLAARPVSALEHQRIFDASLGDLRDPNRSQTVALAGLVPIVAPGQPVRSLTIADLVGIYDGSINNWASLGGNDRAITVHALPRTNGFQEAIIARLLNGVAITSGVERHTDTASLSQAVTSDPGAIALTHFGRTGGSEQIVLRDTCGLLIKLDRLGLKAQDYPLTIPLLIYTPEHRLAKIARDFLAFLRSPAAQIITQRAGFVDQAVQETDMSLKGTHLAQAILAAKGEAGLSRLQSMTAKLAPARRLSLTFRIGGNGRLTAQSRSNLTLLRQASNTGRFDGKTIRIAVFKEPDTPSGQVMRHVETVQDILASAGYQVEIDLFEDILSGACDTGVETLIPQNQIEVWVR